MASDLMAIENVSDTARWVAYYRARESERPDALFHDPFARRLAGEKGEAIAREMRNRNVAASLVVRTVAFDAMILDRVRHHGVDLVVDIAAGLDARPWRLDLPPSLQWCDVDLPAILEYKSTILAGETPRCRYQPIAADVTDAAQRDPVFAELGARATRALVLTEGLLIYLDAADVATLAVALHRIPAFRWWAFDLISPRLLAMISRSHGNRLERAPMRFGPPEGTGFFASAGWREVEFHSTLEDADRLRRPLPGAWLWRLTHRLAPPAKRDEMRRMSGNVLMERND